MLLRHAAKVGAVFYALWGVMHVATAVALFSRLSRGGAAYVAFIGSRLPPSTFEHPYDPVTLGVLWQHGWNLALLGAFAVAIAIRNWKNDRVGYWLNLAVVSAADIGFVFAVLAPGYIRLAEGLSGPAVWIAAAVFSTLGRLHAGRAVTP